MIKQLEASTEQLEKIRSQLEKTDVPREVLEDFKRTIDNTRITLWGMISLTETDLAEGVAHFRLQRAEEMCRQVGLDVEGGALTAENPDLPRFYTTLKDTVGRIARIHSA
jgi:hypothetical protein